MKYLDGRGRFAVGRGTLLLIATGGLATAAGCVMEPYTGTLYDGVTAGYQMKFKGRTDTPNASATAVVAYVLDSAAMDPLSASYTPIGSTSVPNVPLPGNDTIPFFEWGLTSIPLTTAQWPEGGLVRFKVRSGYNGSGIPADMATFTGEGIACLDAEQSLPWRQAGNDCRSFYEDETIITVVSTDPTPAQSGDIPYLGLGGNLDGTGGVPSDHASETGYYYDTIQAPDDLQGFLEKYEFPAGEIRAVYYNKGDLGIGRDMHCKTVTVSGTPTVTACYVTNYGRDEAKKPKPLFGDLDPQVAIDQALHPSTALFDRNKTIGTVAMVHDPSSAANPVQFIAYNEDGKRSEYAALDNEGVFAVADDTVHQAANVNVPDNCLACHGVGAKYHRANDGPTASIDGATFLPFDPEAFVFSTAEPAYSEANMVPTIKSLNTMVWYSVEAPPGDPPTAVTTLLAGMYPYHGTPTGPQDVNSQFSSLYVPPGWLAGGGPGKEVYKEVIKPYCRTCHVSAQSYNDWDSFTELGDHKGNLALDMCGGGPPMPHAEQTQTLFWRSPARAYLVNAYNIGGACAP